MTIMKSGGGVQSCSWLFVVLLMALLGLFVGNDRGVVEATPNHVFGYCIAPRGAKFVGGFSGHSGPHSCFRGMFGEVNASGALFAPEDVTCTQDDVDTAGDTPTCTCLAVPQVWRMKGTLPGNTYCQYWYTHATPHLRLRAVCRGGPLQPRVRLHHC